MSVGLWMVDPPIMVDPRQNQAIKITWPSPATSKHTQNGTDGGFLSQGKSPVVTIVIGVVLGKIPWDFTRFYHFTIHRWGIPWVFTIFTMKYGGVSGVPVHFPIGFQESTWMTPRLHASKALKPLPPRRPRNAPLRQRPRDTWVFASAWNFR